MLSSAALGCKNTGDALAEGATDVGRGAWDKQPRLKFLREPQRVKRLAEALKHEVYAYVANVIQLYINI